MSFKFFRLSLSYLDDDVSSWISRIVVQQGLDYVVSELMASAVSEYLSILEMRAETSNEPLHSVLDEALKNVRAVLLVQ